MNSLISHKNGQIDTIQVNNVMGSDMGDAFIVTDKNIRQVNASAFFGAKLISPNGKGKIEKFSG